MNQNILTIDDCNEHFHTVSNRNHHSENPSKDRDKGTNGRWCDGTLWPIIRRHAFGLPGDFRPSHPVQRAVDPLSALLLSRPFIRSDSKDGLRLRCRLRRGDGNHGNQALWYPPRWPNEAGTHVHTNKTHKHSHWLHTEGVILA